MRKKIYIFHWNQTWRAITNNQIFSSNYHCRKLLFFFFFHSLISYQKTELIIKSLSNEHVVSSLFVATKLFRNLKKLITYIARTYFQVYKKKNFNIFFVKWIALVCITCHHQCLHFLQEQGKRIPLQIFTKLVSIFKWHC